MKLRSILIASIILISSCQKNNEFFFESNIDDLQKNCLAIEQEIHYLENSALKKINRSLRNQKLTNISLALIAIPTVFTSLLFLDFTDDRNIKELEINNRIAALKDLKEFKECPSNPG